MDTCDSAIMAAIIILLIQFLIYLYKLYIFSYSYTEFYTYYGETSYIVFKGSIYILFSFKQVYQWLSDNRNWSVILFEEEVKEFLPHVLL